jgi:hypothetical protein
MAASLELVEYILKSGDEDALASLLDDPESVFWVDWRADDAEIVEDCESILQTGTLAAESLDLPAGGVELYLHYKDKRQKVPLIQGHEDRHITLLALNRMLNPDYEVRFCIASHGSDTLAFLPLASKDWAALERQYGAAVAAQFYTIATTPNLFTDPCDF